MIDTGNRQPTTPLKTGVIRKYLWPRPNLLLREVLQVTLIMSITMVTAWGIGQIMSPANVLMVLLVGVLIAATRSSPGPAIWSAILGFAGYNYLFTEPRYTLFMHHYDDILTALFFLCVAIISGNLAVHLRQQIQALKAARQATETLYTLSLKLMASSDPKTILLTGMQFLQQQFGRYIVVLLPDSERQLKPVTENQTGTPELDANDLEVADRAWRNTKPDTQSDTNWIWQPLISERGAIAVLGMQRAKTALLPEQEQLLDALVREIALALERSYLTQDLETARIQSETEQLRSALLSSVSHDLRTPLSIMIGSVSSLLQYRGQLSNNDEKELLESTLSEAERLNRYIQNLLDMTRLGYGKMKLTRSWVAVEDIIASAIQRLHSVLSRVQVHTHVAEGIPLLYVHAALIEQALINILENAARFSPPDGAIEIEARMFGKDLELTVTDQGPGIPEDERAKIFDMFYTVKKGDRISAGTGLGLAICQGMIGAHGGRIEALAGSHGRGTKIRIMLPLENQPTMPDEIDG